MSAYRVTLRCACGGSMESAAPDNDAVMRHVQAFYEAHASHGDTVPLEPVLDHMRADYKNGHCAGYPEPQYFCGGVMGSGHCCSCTGEHDG